jgi:steroid 5-alpha reductase family enzyme
MFIDGVLGGLVGPVIACVAVVLTAWIIGTLLDDTAWETRLWSVLPAMYMTIFAAEAKLGNVRLNALVVLTMVWGAGVAIAAARQRRAPRTGEFDRWTGVRSPTSVGLSPPVRRSLNLLLVVSYQNIVILLGALPALTIARGNEPLGWLDALAVAGFAVAVFNRSFIAAPSRARANARMHGWVDRLAPAVLRPGLHACVRRPEYMREQAMWWMIYLLAVSASGAWLHRSIVGPVVLIVLFMARIALAEANAHGGRLPTLLEEASDPDTSGPVTDPRLR